jgi:hypothetical protein
MSGWQRQKDIRGTRHQEVGMDPTATVYSAEESDLPAIRPLIAELIATLDDPSGFDVDRAMENCRALLVLQRQMFLVQ